MTREKEMPENPALHKSIEEVAEINSALET